MKPLFFLLIFAAGCGIRSGNLVVNPGAEIPNFDSVPAGWSNISGKWVSPQGDSVRHDFGFAKSGHRYFFGGYGQECILQQEIELSSFAGDIDKGNLHFVLSANEQSLDQGPLSDQGKIRVQCLDASKAGILYRDSTDTLMSISKWKVVTDTFLAPKGTRAIRLQLVSIRHVGGDNDGYFDDISLSAFTPPNTLLIVAILVVVLSVAVGLGFYLRKKT
jgi:hypothetical protein